MTEPSLHDYAWAHELYDELLRYRKALESIARWEMPSTGKFWPNGNEISYEYLYGSNGERSHIRRIAQEALKNSPLAQKESVRATF